MRQSGKFQISIQACLIIGAIGLVVLTAAIVHIPWALTSSANIRDLNTRLDSLVIQSLADKVDSLLDNAVATRDSVALMIESGAVDIDDPGRRRDLFLSVIESQPNLTSIEFGWQDDHSFRVSRAGGGLIHIEEATPSADNSAISRHVVTYRKDDHGAYQMTAEVTAATDYRVTQQFWYLTAFEGDAPAWSNIYRLPDSDQFGVATTRIVAGKTEAHGVIGIAISLDRLSAFLDDVQVTDKSSVFLTNTASQLVAVQSHMMGVHSAASAAQAPPQLADIQLPAVQTVVAALAANALNLQSLKDAQHLDYRNDSFVTLAPLSQMGLIVGVVIPKADVLGAIDRNTRMLLIGLLVFVAIVATAATLAARFGIGKPLARVVANLRQLEDFRFDAIEPVSSPMSEINAVSQATIRMNASLASFKKYIPTELVRTLFAQGIEAELGGEMRELTILFMDLAGFTSISEKLGDRIVDFLGEYLSDMSAIIQEHGGTIDKYIGDAIMAFWGAPIPTDRHAILACRAALACQNRLAEHRLNKEDDTLPEIHARIGLNTGTVLVGNVGSHDRLNYTVIGDPVNVASRLESLNKVYGTHILIGETTRLRAGEEILARPLDRVAVYGKESGIEMFELVALSGSEAAAGEPAWIACYEQARAAMTMRDWDRSITLFRQVIMLKGGDSVAEIQIARAERFKHNPPPEDWDGLVVMDSK